MLDYHAVRNWDFGDIVHSYTERDTMLYALGAGFGADPLDEGQLQYVYEKQLQALPTMVSVIGAPGPWWEDPRTGADYRKRVHGEQSIELFAPIPTAATVVARNRVVSITDKGVGRGAIAVIERNLFRQDDEKLLARSTMVIVLRGDGGYSASGAPSDPPPAPLTPVPEWEPDAVVKLGSVPQQALIYRLSGDYNPLHSDTEVARAAGFQRPILHGLSTFGMAAHAILREFCGYDAQRLRRMALRFSGPVMPGDTLVFELWRSAPERVQFRGRVEGHEKVVLDQGLAEIV